MDFARSRTNRVADTGGVAQNLCGSDGEFLTGAQEHRRAGGKRTSANFRALQISEYGNGFTLGSGGGAQRGNITSVIFVLAVRKIEASYIHARAQQAIDNRRRATCGADGTNNFRMAGHGLQFWRMQWSVIRRLKLYKTRLFLRCKFGNNFSQELEPFVEAEDGEGSS